jgi:hypothetical protein
MATVNFQACDECGDGGPRLVELDNRIYCSRDCYLTACKRIFDARWMELLKSSEKTSTSTKAKNLLLSRIA